MAFVIEFHPALNIHSTSCFSDHYARQTANK